MEIKQDFSKARVGDRVFSIKHGWGVIIEIRLDSTHPLRIDFKSKKSTYTLDGKFIIHDSNPSLFWDNPLKDELPQPPRRKVKKTRDVWINFYSTFTSSGYNSKEIADRSATNDRLGCQKVTLEWEE